MATEYYRIICNNIKRPSPKSVLVSIPMYMYRIRTKKFSDGLDFFQRAVLMFKCGAGIENSTIAASLGLEEDLVNEIQGVLVTSGYLNNSGVLTPKGNAMRNNIDSIVVDQNAKSVGYVFQFVDRNDYYPYFVQTIGEAPNLSSKGEIIVGTKGDGRDGTVNPYSLNFIECKKRNLPFPNERTILELISKTCKGDNGAARLSITQLGRELSLSYLPNPPEPKLVSVCTYIYLPIRDDGLYESEWQVLDPFDKTDSGKINNSGKIKFYLESFKDEEFRDLLMKEFGNAETLGRKKYSDYIDFRENQVEKIIEEDFDVGFDGLDPNLRDYLRSMVNGIYEFRESNYRNYDSAKQFVSGCQVALENIFKTDRERRDSVYEKMEDKYSTPENGYKDFFEKKRYRSIRKLIDDGKIKMEDPKSLYGLCRIEPNNAYSLKHYVYTFILTYEYGEHEPLFGLIDGRVEPIINIANLRNKREHGKTVNEGKTGMLTREQVESIYTFIKDFINTYITVIL